MKKMAFGVLTVLFSVSAMAASASERYLCSAQLPQGQAEVIFENGLKVDQKITLHFVNQARNETYVGSLKITDVSDQGNRIDILAQGTVMGYEEHPVINVTLQGSLASGDAETATLQLYAGGDRRIENGFGNILHCRKQ